MPTATTPLPTAAPARPIRLGWAVLIVAAVVVVFGRAAAFDFVTFDDEVHIADDPYLHPFDAHALAAVWSRPYEKLYIPATYTAWGVLSHLAAVRGPKGELSLDPAVFHLANVVLHAANGVLVWLVLRRVVGSDGPAAVGALLFAVHPLQAEPVAWASGFKDTFSGFWSLLAITLFLRRTRGGYVVATAAFAVALCAKPAAVVVPPIAWLLAWAARERPARAGTGVLLGWLAMSVPFLWVTHRQQADATLLAWNPPAVRPLVVADAAAFYARQLVWPANLTVDYGRTPRWVWDHAGAVAIGIGAVAAAAGLWATRSRLVVAGVAAFLVGVAPVLGAVPFTYQQFSTVSDRYAYLSMVGAALLAAVAARAARRQAIPVAAVVLAALAVRTFVQVGVWRDTTALFTHALDVNPSSALACNGLGVVAERAGNLPLAERYDREAARLDPGEPKYQLAMANVLTKRGHLAEARERRALFLIDAARRVLSADPDSPLAHRSLAQGYELQGRAREAAAEYAVAAQLKAAGHAEKLATDERR
jgi:tetratricopeptide (TPR) repeat protein